MLISYLDCKRSFGMQQKKQLHALFSALQEMLYVLLDRIHLEVYAEGRCQLFRGFFHFHVKVFGNERYSLAGYHMLGIAEGEYHFIFRRMFMFTCFSHFGHLEKHAETVLYEGGGSLLIAGSSYLGCLLSAFSSVLTTKVC